MAYSSSTGRGIDADVQQELARRTGCRFEVSVQPRARTWSDLRAGRVDMAGSGVPTPERLAYVWIEPYLVEKNYMVLARRVGDDVRTLADFERERSLQMGGVRAFSHGPGLDPLVERLRKNHRLEEVADTETLFRMFAAGRFDAFVTSQFLLHYYLPQLPDPSALRIEDWDPVAAIPAGLVLSRRRFSAPQAQAWQGLVRDMVADGTMGRILERYLGPEGRQSLYREAK